MAFTKKSKKIEETANVQPSHPSSGASLEKRPVTLNEAAKLLGLQLNGANVVGGHGFGDGADRNTEWRLYVFTNDESLVIPKKFEGFRVSKRGLPVASPAWGKLAVKMEKAAREKEAQTIKDDDSVVETNDSVDTKDVI